MRCQRWLSFLLIGVLALLAHFAGGIGCATRPAAVRAAHDTLATTKSVAQGALRTWAVYVADERERIARLPAPDRFEPNRRLLLREGHVKDAAFRFNAVFGAAEAPLRAAVENGQDFLAPPAVTAALSELTGLVIQFTKP